MINCHTTRRDFLRNAATAASSFAFAPHAIDAKTESIRPNIVLIIGDDISQHDFGCYGTPSIRTPNVDKLAANGLRFTNAYLTVSQCSPTRCSIITGRYPHNTGAPELHMPLPEGQVMFPEQLKRAGYHTAAAGKWHMGNYARRAFDKVVGGGAGGEERWIDCLQKRPKDKPFFMWFASYDAHRPWDDKIEAKRHTPKDVIIPPYMVDITSERTDMARYYDEVQRLDRYTGYVVEELKKQGVLDNTIIIFMADNGRPFWRAKTRLYDSGIKTPFVVHWPAGLREKGQICNSLVSVIDIAPTILEWAGLKSPKTFQGTSFTPLLADTKASIRKYVFAEHNWHSQIAHERMVRHGDYVYIRNAHRQLSQVIVLKSSRPNLDELREMAKDGKLTEAQMDPLLAPRPAEELFDLRQDPHQVKNLVADPAYRKPLEQLRKLMDQWQARTGDTVPSLDVATPDRHDRKTGKRIRVKGKGMRPSPGVVPGQATGADKINDPGPR
ncbi:MAG: sulfatase [Phycisphaerae bacterium]|nr:sulfatase [Phycisphaerae bacterium]